MTLEKNKTDFYRREMSKKGDGVVRCLLQVPRSKWPRPGTEMTDTGPWVDPGPLQGCTAHLVSTSPVLLSRTFKGGRLMLTAL